MRRTGCGLSVCFDRFLNGGCGLLQIFREHDWRYFNLGVKGQEPRFGDGRDLRRILQIEDQNGRTLPVLRQKYAASGFCCSGIARMALKESFFAAAFPASTGMETLNRNRMKLSPSSGFDDD
jgi:hypothetical protein